MTVYFRVTATDEERFNIRQYAEPHLDSAEVNVVTRGQIAAYDAASPENKSVDQHEGTTEADWRHVRTGNNKLALNFPGWIETRFLGEQLDGPVMPDISPAEFVRHCALQEMLTASSLVEGAKVMLADYLIAIALLESDLTDLNPDFDALGPYHHSAADWTRFITANPQTGLTEASKFFPLHHITCAAWIAQTDWQWLEDRAKTTELEVDGQPYVPTFATIFHCRLFGREAAFRMALARRSEDTRPLSQIFADVFDDEAELKAVLDRRKKYLNGSSDISTITAETVHLSTEHMLTEKLRRALTLLRDHFPEFVKRPASQAPWLDVALEEYRQWTGGDSDPSNDLVEGTGEGLEKVRAYFASIGQPGLADPPAWCGAFAAHCMIKSGSAAAVDSVVAGPAWAANWLAWGGTQIRLGDLDRVSKETLKGAVVVLHPSSGASGHVAFVVERIQQAGVSKLNCVGGNQGNPPDRVRISAFDYGRIRKVMVMPQDPDLPAIEADVGADDRLTLARTIFGEAEGESDDGKRAVAQVIMNRVASGRFPMPANVKKGIQNTVRGICREPSQFEPWNLGNPRRAVMLSHDEGSTNARFQTCLRIAGEAIAGNISVLDAPAQSIGFAGGDILFFANSSKGHPWWYGKSPGAQFFTIGNHTFYGGIR